MSPADARWPASLRPYRPTATVGTTRVRHRRQPAKDVIRHLGLPRAASLERSQAPLSPLDLRHAHPTEEFLVRRRVHGGRRCHGHAAEQGETPKTAGWADGMGPVAADRGRATPGLYLMLLTIPAIVRRRGGCNDHRSPDWPSHQRLGEDRMGHVGARRQRHRDEPDPVARFVVRPNRQTAIHFIEFLLLSPEGLASPELLRHAAAPAAIHCGELAAPPRRLTDADGRFYQQGDQFPPRPRLTPPRVCKKTFIILW